MIQLIERYKDCVFIINEDIIRRRCHKEEVVACLAAG
jgi:hypothetical protein